MGWPVPMPRCCKGKILCYTATRAGDVLKFDERLSLILYLYSMILLVVLWVLFFVSHSVLAANPVKAKAAVWLGNNYRFYRLFFNLLSLVFLGGILLVLLYRQPPNFMFQTGNVSMVLASLLILIGGAISVMAFRNYDLKEFTGIKQITEKGQHPSELVVKGLNAYVRNPLYFGLILFVLGLFFAQPTTMNLVSLLMVYAYLYIGVKLEEEKLLQEFGEPYRDYQSRVKMLIPFLF